MITPLIPQEIYLLERYASLIYFGHMRDEFAACVKTAEDALEAFMLKLPPNYRSRPQFEQPDRGWGEIVIPNLQWALRGLNEGYITQSHGNADGLGMVGNLRTSFASITRDYSWEWMPDPYGDEYQHHDIEARIASANISATQQGNWRMYSLSRLYTEDNRGPLDPPASWPLYRLNHAVCVRSGAKVPQSGVYLPDAPNSCAQYLIKDYEAWDCSFLLRPDDLDDRSLQRIPTTWTLIERVADEGGGVPGAADDVAAGLRFRCLASEHCPRQGFWVTPARADSRRWFKQGELMPDVGGDYGLTIWQWDENQG